MVTDTDGCAYVYPDGMVNVAFFNSADPALRPHRSFWIYCGVLWHFESKRSSALASSAELQRTTFSSSLDLALAQNSPCHHHEL